MNFKIIKNMDEENAKRTPKDSSSAIEENGSEEAEKNADQQYLDDLEELEKARQEHEERKKEELERMRKEKAIKGHEDADEDNEESGNSTESTVRKADGGMLSKNIKTFSTEKKLFRHNKMYGFSGRGKVQIDKALKKAHINTEKRRGLIEALAAYNPSKTLLLKKDFNMFARKFKSRNFSGTKFQQGFKSVDFKSLRKDFSKRDLNKFRMAVTGESDSHKYQTKTAFTNPSKSDKCPSSSKH